MHVKYWLLFKEEEFSFRLFAHQPLAKVAISEDTKDDGQAQAVADMQQLEFDEHDPELMARVKEAAIDYKDILRQSTVPYPAMQFHHRVIDINTVNKSVTEKSNEEEKAKSVVILKRRSRQERSRYSPRWETQIHQEDGQVGQVSWHECRSSII